MAMTAKLWSINALSVELRMDRRTVASRLHGVPADGTIQGSPAWWLPTALRALHVKGAAGMQPAGRTAAPAGGLRDPCRDPEPSARRADDRMAARGLLDRPDRPELGAAG